MEVIQRLHEQREFPSDIGIPLTLKKGIMLETLTWDKDTEDVDIKERLVLKKFNWTRDGNYDFLTMEFKKVDLEEYKKIVDDLAEKILDKHFEIMKYTFMKGLIERAKRMVEKGYLVVADIKRMEKHDNKKKVGK